MVRRPALTDRCRVRGGRLKKLRTAFRWRLTRQGLSDWKAKLAEEFPGEAAFIPQEEKPEEAESEFWHSLYWRAWEALRYDRFYGAMGGEGPITYMAISQYARDNGIAGDDFRVFHILIAAIDAEWLAFAAERDKAEREKRK